MKNGLPLMVTQTPPLGRAPHFATLYKTFLAKVRFDSMATKDVTLPCFV